MAYSAEEQIIVESIITQIDDEYYRQINEYSTLCRSLGVQPGADTSLTDPISIKALFVMLYSHYEGFIKFASLRYVELVNRLNIDTILVKPQFAAASLHPIFRDIEQNQTKCDFFRNSLPDDSAIHRLYRRSHLVDQLHSLWSYKTIVDESYIDTESNLKYDILCRTLYSIGLNPQLMAPYQSEIGLLLRYRNPIAHGETITDNVYLTLYTRIASKTLTVIDEYRRLIKNAIINQEFLKNAA